MKPKKVLISAGGTGGHTFPAQGLAQQIRSSSNGEVLFVAGGLSSNRYFDRNQFKYKEVSCSPIVTKNPLKLLKGISNMFRGVYQSIKIVKQFKPDVVVGFGSFYTVPVLIAAKFLKVPILLHEANSVPGKANQWFAPFAKCTGIHFPSTAKLLRGPSLEVGLPLREGYKSSLISKVDAKKYFNLDDKTFTVLIFGGSQGAKAINQVIMELLDLGFDQSLQVIHLTGNENTNEGLSKKYKECGIKATVKTFETKMNLAWAAADIFIGRSGAATIAEAMEFEVPGILIPFPFATENHQEKNAEFLVNDVKGAFMLLEKHMTAEGLKKCIHTLLQDYNKLHKSIQNYKQRPDRIAFYDLVMDGKGVTT